MIQQVLDKAFLRDLVERMRAQARAAVNDDRRAGSGTRIDELSTEEKSQLLADLEIAKMHIGVESSEAGDRRGGAAGLSLADRNTFIRRSPELYWLGRVRATHQRVPWCVIASIGR